MPSRITIYPYSFDQQTDQHANSRELFDIELRYTLGIDQEVPHVPSSTASDVTGDTVLRHACQTFWKRHGGGGGGGTHSLTVVPLCSHCPFHKQEPKNTMSVQPGSNNEEARKTSNTQVLISHFYCSPMFQLIPMTSLSPSQQTHSTLPHPHPLQACRFHCSENVTCVVPCQPVVCHICPTLVHHQWACSQWFFLQCYAVRFGENLRCSFLHRCAGRTRLWPGSISFQKK